MATTLSGDVKIYDPQFYGGYVETLQQETNAFNAASAGTLVMRERTMPGQYEKESFFDEVSSISRRDPSANAAATPVKLTQDEFISVKLHRRNGPYEWTITSANLAGFDAREFSRAVGVQTAKASAKEMLDRALAALEGKLDATAALEYDRTAGTMRLTDLNSGVALFGDAASNIRLFVMHSVPFFNLVGEQITGTNAVYSSNIFGATVYAGMPVTLGRPVLVTDSPSLISYTDVSSDSPVYSTLGLVAAAATCDVTEPPLAVAEGPQTGKDNLYVTFQSEYSFNLGLKGCAYHTATGANPTNAAVATGSNWDTKVASNKLLPGIIIRSL